MKIALSVRDGRFEAQCGWLVVTAPITSSGLVDLLAQFGTPSDFDVDEAMAEAYTLLQEKRASCR